MTTSQFSFTVHIGFFFNVRFINWSHQLLRNADLFYTVNEKEKEKSGTTKKEIRISDDIVEDEEENEGREAKKEKKNKKSAIPIVDSINHAERLFRDFDRFINVPLLLFYWNPLRDDDAVMCLSYDNDIYAYDGNIYLFLHVYTYICCEGYVN